MNYNELHTSLSPFEVEQNFINPVKNEPVSALIVPIPEIKPRSAAPKYPRSRKKRKARYSAPSKSPSRKRREIPSICDNFITMNFQVPQFIEQKPKIVGFLTLPQFLYVAGAAILGYISFYVFNFFFAIIITVFAGLIGIAFAFVKVNGQEFPKIIVSVFGYLWGPRLYTWQRQTARESVNINEVEELRGQDEPPGKIEIRRFENHYRQILQAGGRS